MAKDKTETEKKLTPLQESIRKTKLTLIEFPKSHRDMAFNEGIMKTVEILESLLPKEKEFAKDIWDYSDEMGGLIDFNKFFKQFEP